MLSEGPPGYLDSDLACAIALGFVEPPLLAERGRTVPNLRAWMASDDLLVTATRDCLRAAGECADSRAVLARALAWALVVERGVLARAAAAGLRVKKSAVAHPGSGAAGPRVWSWNGWPPLSPAERN